MRYYAFVLLVLVVLSLCVIPVFASKGGGGGSSGVVASNPESVSGSNWRTSRGNNIADQTTLVRNLGTSFSYSVEGYLMSCSDTPVEIEIYDVCGGGVGSSISVSPFSSGSLGGGSVNGRVLSTNIGYGVYRVSMSVWANVNAQAGLNACLRYRVVLPQRQPRPFINHIESGRTPLRVLRHNSGNLVNQLKTLCAREYCARNPDDIEICLSVVQDVEESCKAIFGEYAWRGSNPAGSRCCGSGLTTYGMIHNNYLCGSYWSNELTRKHAWLQPSGVNPITAQPVAGDIVLINSTVGEQAVVSDGESWIACGASRANLQSRNHGTRLLISNPHISSQRHEYICLDQGDNSIFRECRGNTYPSLNNLGYGELFTALSGDIAVPVVSISNQMTIIRSEMEGFFPDVLPVCPDGIYMLSAGVPECLINCPRDQVLISDSSGLRCFSQCSGDLILTNENEGFSCQERSVSPDDFGMFTLLPYNQSYQLLYDNLSPYYIENTQISLFDWQASGQNVTKDDYNYAMQCIDYSGSGIETVATGNNHSLTVCDCSDGFVREYLGGGIFSCTRTPPLPDCGSDTVLVQEGFSLLCVVREDILGVPSCPSGQYPVFDSGNFLCRTETQLLTPPVAASSQSSLAIAPPVKDLENKRVDIFVDTTNGVLFNPQFVVFGINPYATMDWSDAQYLYIPFKYFNAPHVDIGLYFGNIGGEDVYRIIEDGIKYSITGKQPQQWHLLKIPLSNFNHPMDAIQGIGIIFNASLPVYQVAGMTHQFSIGEMFIDKDLFFCSGHSGFTGLENRFEWIADVDEYRSPPSGQSTYIRVGESACNALSFASWTGTRCCGDDGYIPGGEDYFLSSEFYFDTEASCWGGRRLDHGSVVEIFDYVIESPGTNSFSYVHSCIGTICFKPIRSAQRTGGFIDSTQSVYFDTGGNILVDSVVSNAPLLRLYSHSPQILSSDSGLLGCYAPEIVRVAYATNDDGRVSNTRLLSQNIQYDATDILCEIRSGYYCSPQGFWSDNVSVDSIIAYSPTDMTHIAKHYNTSQGASCCPQNHCWDGDKCVLNQYDQSTELPIGGNPDEGYRCINGDWQYSYRKYDWYNRQSGFCPDDSHCFVDHDVRLSMGSSPQCVESGQDLGSFVCRDGDWESRTRVLANYMINLAAADFTLYCDVPENVANYAWVRDGKSILDVLRGLQATGFGRVYSCASSFDAQQPCVNNLCVLENRNQGISDRYVGFSLNRDIDPSQEIEQLLGIGECGSGNDSFVDCSSFNDGQWYHHRGDGLVLYQRNLGNAISDVLSVIRSWGSWLFGVAGGTTPVSTFDMSSHISSIIEASGANHLDRLYISRHEDKAIIGVLERFYQDGQESFSLYVHYHNVEPSADLCERVTTYVDAHGLDISCQQYSQSDVNVFVVQGVDRNSDTIWQYITSSLRWV